MRDPNCAAVFEAIDSFLLTPDKVYGIIGDVLEGEIKEGYFVHIPLNSSLSISARIDKVQDIQMSRFSETHKVIFVEDQDDDFAQILHCLNVGAETLEITITGEE